MMIRSYKSLKLYQQMAICTLILFILPDHTSQQEEEEEIVTTTKRPERRLIEFPIIDEEPVVINATTNHTATVIFMPDYFEYGLFWARKIKENRQPYMKVICPNADKFQLFMYHLKSLILPSTYYELFTSKNTEVENEHEIDRVTKYVHKLIEDEIKSGIPPERIIVGGHSQGAVLALNAALSFPKKLGGIIALSTWDPLNKTYSQTFNPVNKDIAVFQGNLIRNPFTTNQTQGETMDLLRNHVTKNIDFNVYPGDHKTCREEMDDLSNFLANHLPPVPTQTGTTD